MQYFEEGVSETPDDYKAVSGSWDNPIKMWDLKSGDLIFTSQYDGAILSCCIAPSGMVIAGDAGGRVIILKPVNFTLGS